MNRYLLSNRMLSLVLILFCTSCEELIIDTKNPFEAESSEQIPDLTKIDETINGSSASFSWEGNDFALEFRYKLQYSLTDSTHMVNQPYFNWSDWKIEKEANFDNLDEGNYTFYVKSRFDLIEEEETDSQPYMSRSFQIDVISGPALRVYPLSQTASSGDEIDVYLYFEEVDANNVNSVNLLQVDLRFSGTSGSDPSNALVELNGEVENMSSSLHCSSTNDNPLEILTTNNLSNDYGGFDMTIMQSYLDDNGMGLCDTGPLVRIPLRILAENQSISIEIVNAQFKYYHSENDEFQEIEFNWYSGSVIVEDTVQ